MNLAFWLALGALSGWTARALLELPPASLPVNVLTGVAGAALGGFLAVRLGLYPIAGLNLYSLWVAVLGACLLLMILSWIRKRIG